MVTTAISRCKWNLEGLDEAVGLIQALEERGRHASQDAFLSLASGVVKEHPEPRGPGDRQAVFTSPTGAAGTGGTMAGAGAVKIL